MSKTRSPKYPSIDLAEAVELAEKLWFAEKKTAVPIEVLAKAWGYKGDSGPVRAKVGAMRQYGLLDGTKHGLKISDLALEIVVQPDGSTEKKSAIKKAALNPPLFSDVYKTHSESSEDALKAYLITKKGFSDTAATKFTSSFKATIALAYPDGYEYDEPEDDTDMDEEQMEEALKERNRNAHNPPPPGSASLFLMVPFRGSKMSVKIDSGGQKLTKGHIERIRKYLQLAEDDLEEELEDTSVC